MFHTKYKSDDTIERLKACLVAQCLTQVLGFDNSLTFSLVVKATIVRLVLSFVVFHDGNFIC